jgi:hypothetical protein
VKSRHSIIALAAASITVLSACGASAPPAKELAVEMVDTLDESDAVKACMRQEVEDFNLTEEQATGFSDLDDVASKAAGGSELALQIMGDFQDALATCR